MYSIYITVMIKTALKAGAKIYKSANVMTGNEIKYGRLRYCQQARLFLDAVSNPGL